MWEKIAVFLFAHLIPLTLVKSPGAFHVPPELSFAVEPLAINLEDKPPVPTFDAKAVLIIESHSNQTLLAHAVWESLPIASLTKLMTSLVVREKLDPELTVKVSSRIASVSGSRMGLIEGEEILVKDLLKGLLISSGNDAAFVLSEAVSGTPEAFVKLMNERKISLGLEKTVFADPSGISDQNVSSAFEIAH